MTRRMSFPLLLPPLLANQRPANPSRKIACPGITDESLRVHVTQRGGGRRKSRGTARTDPSVTGRKGPRFSCSSRVHGAARVHSGVRSRDSLHCCMGHDSLATPLVWHRHGSSRVLRPSERCCERVFHG